MLRLLAATFGLLLLTTCAVREQWQAEDRQGDMYEIHLEAVSETSGDGSTSSTRSVATLSEQLVALRNDGVELEFNLPAQASQEDQAKTWQFPARVLKSPGRPLQLLNVSELKARLRSWLERGGLNEAACGRWIFTWTAFKIECDPNSVLETLEPFDLRLSDLHDGAPYTESGALASAPLRKESRSPNGLIFVAELKIDPEVVRQERAHADVAIAEIMRGEPVVLEVALQAWEAKQITGTITTTLETDTVGRVTRRTQVTDIVIVDEDGSQQREISTVTVERRLASRSEGSP